MAVKMHQLYSGIRFNSLSCDSYVWKFVFGLQGCINLGTRWIFPVSLQLFALMFSYQCTKDFPYSNE